MKRVAILCQTGPGGKRRLAEEALRVAAGLTATGRVRIDLILSATALALLQPELGGPAGNVGIPHLRPNPNPRSIGNSPTRNPAGYFPSQWRCRKSR